MNIFWDTGHMVVDFFLLDVEKPQIALHPQSGVVTSGGSAFFTCTHSNTHLSISWFKNGLRIPGSMTKTTDRINRSRNYLFKSMKRRLTQNSNLFRPRSNIVVDTRDSKRQWKIHVQNDTW